MKWFTSLESMAKQANEILKLHYNAMNKTEWLLGQLMAQHSNQEREKHQVQVVIGYEWLDAKLYSEYKKGEEKKKKYVVYSGYFADTKTIPPKGRELFYFDTSWLIRITHIYVNGQFHFIESLNVAGQSPLPSYNTLSRNLTFSPGLDLSVGQRAVVAVVNP